VAAAKPKVVSNLEINSISEKFRRISPIIFDSYVAGIITEQVNNYYTTAPAKFKMAVNIGSSYKFGHVIHRNAI
jgi:hypothetical protein